MRGWNREKKRDKKRDGEKEKAKYTIGKNPVSFDTFLHLWWEVSKANTETTNSNYIAEKPTVSWCEGYRKNCILEIHLLCPLVPTGIFICAIHESINYTQGNTKHGARNKDFKIKKTRQCIDCKVMFLHQTIHPTQGRIYYFKHDSPTPHSCLICHFIFHHGSIHLIECVTSHTGKQYIWSLGAASCSLFAC